MIDREVQLLEGGFEAVNTFIRLRLRKDLHQMRASLDKAFGDITAKLLLGAREDKVEKIDYRANFLCIKWDADVIRQAKTSEELVDAMCHLASLVTLDNASSCSLLVIGAFVREYLRDSSTCDSLKAYLRTEERAFACHCVGNVFKQMRPADIQSAICLGSLCGGAGYKYLLTSDDLERLEDPTFGIG